MISWDGIDRRRFVRVRVSFKAHVYDPERVTVLAYAEEISQRGVRLSIKKELKASSTVDLDIFLREEPIKCKGKVVWVKKVEGEYLEGGFIFDVGIELRDLSQKDKQIIKTFVLRKKKEQNL